MSDDDRVSLVTVLKARVHAHQLDEALAAGADPAGSDELGRRAAHLTSRRYRIALARGLDNAVDFPDASRFMSAAVHPPAPILRAVSPSVRALADALRAALDPSPRGVALAQRLLVDTTSPLYCAATVDEAVAAVDRAREAL